MRIALIDADTLVYQSARGNEVEIEWDQGITTLHCEFDPCRAHLDDMVESIMEKTGADEAIMALTDYNDPWRKRVMPTYKNNRKNVRKPLVFNPLREYIQNQYYTKMLPGCEGDDVLGILLTDPTSDDDRVVVSIDKDMKTLPGAYFNLNTEKTIDMPLCGADYWHLMQTLTGDTVDGYRGCPGVGPKGAAKILDPFLDTYLEAFDVRRAWPAVVAAYEKKGLSEEAALDTARVARICRYSDYDFRKGEVILWTP